MHSSSSKGSSLPPNVPKVPQVGVLGVLWFGLSFGCCHAWRPSSVCIPIVL